ncbi:hypothetical protein ACFP65_09510 [Marinilactibacillus sp. GCM10026970]|uniref:hypothetical protein n=1 Tax=Marinilactibacillus sp. GCM10026970 TaxID=3252642 RepID=UPI0036089863
MLFINNSSSWIYQQVVYGITEKYGKANSKLKYLSFLKKKRKSTGLLLLYFLLVFAAVFFLYSWEAWKIVFIDNGWSISRAVTLFVIIELILIAMTFITLILAKKTSDLEPTLISRDDISIVTTTKEIFDNLNINNEANIQKILKECDKVIESSNYKFEVSVKYFNNFLLLFFLTPVGFLLSIAISQATDSDLTDNLLPLSTFLDFVVLIAYVMLIITFLIQFLLVVAYSEAFINFFYLDRKNAIIVKKFVGVLEYKGNAIIEPKMENQIQTLINK